MNQTEVDEDLLMLLRMVAAYEKVRDWNERWFAGEDPDAITDVERRGALAIVSLSYKEEMEAASKKIARGLDHVKSVQEKLGYSDGIGDTMTGLASLAVLMSGASTSGVPLAITDIDYDRIDESIHERLKEKGRKAGLWPLSAENS